MKTFPASHVISPERDNSLSRILGLGEDDVRRKGSQMGSVYAHGDSWAVSFSQWVKDTSGNLAWKRTSRTVGPRVGPKKIGQKEAKRLAAEIVGKANSVNALPQGLATVAQFVEARFWPEHVMMLKKSGQLHYATQIRAHVLPTLGGMNLSDVDADIVQRLLTAKAGHLSAQSVAHIRNTISAIFRHARRLKFFAGQLPTEDLSLPTIRPAEKQSLTYLQVRLLADAMPQRYQPLVLLLAQTGMRVGEAAALRWCDVNLTDKPVMSEGEAILANSLLVRRNIAKRELTTLKGRDKLRRVPLTAETWVALVEQAERLGDVAVTSPVFPSSTGLPFDSNNLRNRHLKAAARKIGLPWIGWHTLRHTAATLGDIAGLTPAEKMRVLGHTTQALSNRYTHPEMERTREALERIQ